jgi:hypothetical protein
MEQGAAQDLSWGAELGHESFTLVDGLVANRVKYIFSKKCSGTPMLLEASAVDLGAFDSVNSYAPHP